MRWNVWNRVRGHDLQRVSGFGSLDFAIAVGGMEIQGDVDENISISSGSLSPDLGDIGGGAARKALIGTVTHRHLDRGRGYQRRRHEEPATSLERALLGRAFLDPGDVLGMRKTASRWNISGEYGPYGELFFFLTKEAPTISGEVVDFERDTSSDAEDGVQSDPASLLTRRGDV